MRTLPARGIQRTVDILDEMIEMQPFFRSRLLTMATELEDADMASRGSIRKQLKLMTRA